MLCYNISCSNLGNSYCFTSWSLFFYIYIFVSSGLCSWIYFLIFPYPSAVWVDITTELVAKCVTLVFAAWHRLYFWTILPLFKCSSILYFYFRFWLRPHLPLLSFLCYAWIWAFLKGITNTIFPTSPCCLFTLVNVNVFLFLEHLHLVFLLESLLVAHTLKYLVLKLAFKFSFQYT